MMDNGVIITGIISIIVALIGAGATILTVILSSRKNSAEMDAKLDKALAVQETKIDELTREVREHNGFAHRMPVLEEQIKGIDRRLSDLERKTKT